MHKTITEQNLGLLIDALIREGIRVVGPRRSGALCLYEPLDSAAQLVTGELPRRSAKEAFFPQSEPILSFQRDKDGVRIQDGETDAFAETLIIGAPPCDADGPAILDAVFGWDYRDEFFLQRREKTTLIALACTRADSACFCTSLGLDPGHSSGADILLAPLEGGAYAVDARTEKGTRLLERHPKCFTGPSDAPRTAAASPQKIDLDQAGIKAWLDANFEHPLWAQIAERCAGCGSCAFICPACHCFDIVDEGTETQGTRRKFWDACGFAKFTNHASGHNPRDGQPLRYRNRVMHKFKYYQDKFGKNLCTGCGRCVRNCPVGIDIAEVLETINNFNRA